MPNKYSYIGGNDLNGRMFVYEGVMKMHDLNSEAIRTFAKALRAGNLETIREQFKILDPQQRQGLLTMLIDYNDLEGNFMNLNAPYGKPIDLTKKFGHSEISTYLTRQSSKEISSLAQLCVEKLVKNPTFFNQEKASGQAIEQFEEGKKNTP